ncbi:MAG: hypothetical protein NVS4B12_01190 [Ktedonobacteraceae bacterium]
MLPERATKFFTALDEHAFSLTENLNTMVTQLATYEKATLYTSIASLLHQHKFRTQLLDNERFLICGRYATEKTSTLLLFSHCPPHPDAWARWGTFVTRLLTFALYHEAIGSIPMNVLWVVDTEEYKENDNAASHFIENNRILLQADGCLYDLPSDSSRPAPFLALGTKGILSVEVGVQMRSHERHSLYGAILPNPAWRLLWALNSLKDRREEILIEGFYDTLVPMEDEEIALIRNTPNDEALQQRMNVDEFLLQLHGFQLHYTHLLLPTCTVTSIHSGDTTLEMPHTLPSYAQASIDIHLVPQQESEDIYTKLRMHLDTQGFQDVYTKANVQQNPQHTALQNTFAQLVCTTAYTTYEDIPVFPLLPEAVFCYPFTSLLNIPVVYIQLGYFQRQHSERDTVTTTETRERQKQFLTNNMKHLAMLIEGMVDTTVIVE